MTALLLLALAGADTLAPPLADSLPRFPRLARTQTAFTSLYYGTGTGTDRLGGAKRETLDSGVVLRLTGQTSTLYRVELAPNQTAYVPTEQVTVADTLAPPTPPTYLTANWTVSGDSTFDYVAIRLPARLPYQTRQEVAPNRLVLDLFGADVNTNWITQLRSAQTIERVWLEAIADRHVRVYIALKQPRHGPTHWGYSVYYQRNTLTVRIRRPPAGRSLRDVLIAVDAGHGGSNTGAKGGQTGQLEKDLTLDVARRLATYLTRAGARVVLVRDADTNLTPTVRLRAMRQLLPRLLVSIHFNSSGNASVRGVSTYYRHLGFRPWSVGVLGTLLQQLPVGEFGNIGHFNFFFNSPTDYPNLLVEGPFLSNSDDEKLITNPDFRQKMARAIWRGIRKVRGSRLRVAPVGAACQ
jgi:N-acetylmuramoyl-L-alanine amidase